MRHAIAAAGIGVMLVAATAGVATASGTGHDAPSAASTTRTFTLVERAITDTTTDTGATGDSVGDVLTFANPIFDHDNAHRLGSDNGSCLRTKVGAAYECAWTTSVPGGSLSVAGPFYDAGDSMLAITGGTGKYATARGQLRLHARDSAGTVYAFTFSVVTPAP